MSGLEYKNLSSDKKKKIEQHLVDIFKDVYYNNPNILKAKSESDIISDKIRRFILGFAEVSQTVNEVDLLLKAKEKGQELVESHELVFFDEKVDKNLKMRAFLIPGMKVDFTEENAAEKITEDDLQTVDHELCISFKLDDANEFTKLGSLIDIRTALARVLSGKSQDQKEVANIVKENGTFKESLQSVLDSANRVLSIEG